MTQQEAIEAIDKTIFSKPIGIPDDQLHIMVSQEIADHLVDYYNTINSIKYTLYKKKGESFYWKGVKCVVS